MAPLKAPQTYADRQRHQDADDQGHVGIEDDAERDGAHAQDGADRDVDATAYDDRRHAESHDPDEAGVLKDIEEIAGRRELG